MDWLRKIVQDPRTERVIMALIIVNAVTLGLETSESVMVRFGAVLTVIDRVIIAVFVLEILARFLVQRGTFFREGWNIFDVVVVGIALAPATSAFSLLRALRVLRLLRLITAVPALQRVVGGLIGALPGMGSILLLIGLVFYVSAVMAVNLYGKDYPDLFGTLRHLALYARRVAKGEDTHPFSISTARKSLTLVSVGPVTSRSPIALKKVHGSLSASIALALMPGAAARA